MSRQRKLLPAADEGTFERICAQLNPEWIEAALAATGTATVRRRRLPAEQVIWLVLGMALYRHRPITDLVERLELVLPGAGAIAPSSVAQARSRLGSRPMCWLFEKTAEEWGHASARRHEWNGLALYGVDGTTARIPDSEENRAHFGGQTDRNGGLSGYPQARLVTLMALRSHLLCAARFGPYRLSEHLLAMELWSMVPDNSLCIVDRNFLASGILVPLVEGGVNRHWMVRAKSTTVWKTLKRLGPGDELVEMNVTSYSRKQDASLPQRFQARAIRYKRKGFRPQTLLTSLVDAQKYPAAEVVALYHERWELELGFDEVKTEMLERQEALRSQTREGCLTRVVGRRAGLQSRATRDGAYRRRSRSYAGTNQLRHGPTTDPRRVDVACRGQSWRYSKTASPSAPGCTSIYSASTQERAAVSQGRQNQDEQLREKASRSAKARC